MVLQKGLVFCKSAALEGVQFGAFLSCLHETLSKNHGKENLDHNQIPLETDRFSLHDAFGP
jgi:hypothetical protein